MCMKDVVFGHVQQWDIYVIVKIYTVKIKIIINEARFMNNFENIYELDSKRAYWLLCKIALPFLSKLTETHADSIHDNEVINFGIVIVKLSYFFVNLLLVDDYEVTGVNYLNGFAHCIFFESVKLLARITNWLKHGSISLTLTIKLLNLDYKARRQLSRFIVFFNLINNAILTWLNSIFYSILFCKNLAFDTSVE